MFLLILLAKLGCSNECSLGFEARGDGNCYQQQTEDTGDPGDTENGHDTATDSNDSSGNDDTADSNTDSDSSQDSDTGETGGSSYDAPAIAGAVGLESVEDLNAKNTDDLLDSDGLVIEGSGPDFLRCEDATGLCRKTDDSVLIFSLDGGPIAYGLEDDGSGGWNWSVRDRPKLYPPAKGEDPVGGYVDISFSATAEGPIAVAFAVPTDWKAGSNADPASIEGPHDIYMSVPSTDGGHSFREWYWIAADENVTDPSILVEPDGGCILYVSLGDTAGRAESDDCRTFSAIERLTVEGGVPDAEWDERGNVVLVTNRDGWLRVATSTDGGTGRTFGTSTQLVEYASGGTVIRNTDNTWRVAMQNDGNRQ